MLTIEDSPGGKPVHFLDHCVMCLRKLTDSSSETVGFAPKFKQQSKSKGSSDSENSGLPHDVFNYAWSHVMGTTKRQAIRFPMTPPICKGCGALLQRTSTLLRQLEKATITIKGILRDSGRNGVFGEQRFFRFLKELRTSQEVDDGSRRATLNFLEKMGHGMMTEADYQAWFNSVDNPEAVGEEMTRQDVLIDTFIESLATNASVNPETTIIDISEAVESMDAEIQVLQVVIQKPQTPSKTPLTALKRCTAPASTPIRKPPQRGPVQSGMQTCDFCNEKIPRSESLDHIQGHVGDYALKCPYSKCRAAFATLIELKRHLRRHSDKASTASILSKLHKCEVCSYKCKHFQALRTHLEVSHETASKPYPCPLTSCSERFTIRQSVQCHVMRHAAHYIINKGVKVAPPMSQICDQCSETIEQDKMLYHLQMTHNISPESIIACKYCPFLFSSRIHLVDHFVVHITSGQTVACDLCEEANFLSVTPLRRHYFQKHQVGSKFICEHEGCAKEYLSLTSLRAHKRRHAEDHPAPTSNWNEYKRFKCDQCPDSVLYRQQDLRKHQIQAHGMEPYKCQFCEKTFYLLLHLRKHENEHKGVVPEVEDQTFLCNFCEKTFKRKNLLKSHCATVHSTERKFVCDECGERFKTSGVLKQHKLIHTGERPFSCPVCGQAFRHREVLKTHVKGHQEKGDAFKPNGPMKGVRKRIGQE